MKIKLFIIYYLLLIICFTVYSFSQVDLNLTLNQNPSYLSFQKKLTELGYFNRPLSTVIFLFLIFLLFTFYYLLFTAVKNQKLKGYQITPLIISTVVLLLSYPAFSHDIFNYIFDAKIVWVYKQNPWKKAPIEFIGDPMLRFMHWVHRPSVYLPLWIGLSLPAVIFSFNKFILQLFWMKFLITVFHLGTTFLIYRILDKVNPKNRLLGTVFFAFSPLVLVEDLISAHSDIVMAFFALLSIYLFLRKKWAFSFLSLLFSIGIKYVTAIFLPFLFLGYFLTKKEKKIDFSLAFRILAWVCLLFFTIFIFKFEFQPWYLIWTFPFVALAIEDKILVGLTTSLSIAGLFRYVPFLYYGHYNFPVPQIKLWLTTAPVWVLVLFLGVKKVISYFPKKALVS